MWYNCTDHRPDYHKWLKDDKFCRSQIMFTETPRPGPGRPSAGPGLSSAGAQVTGHGRCDTICRLPCSLQPLPAEAPRPRPRLSTAEDWARARQEVEERRERARLAEREEVDRRRRQQERDNSEAVRIARSKLLDKVTIDISDIIPCSL